MPRQNRLLDPDGGVYHITVRGNNKMCVFHDRFDYLKYQTIIQEARFRFPFKVYHFSLMPNHVHLCVEPGIGTDLPNIMKRINENYSRYFREKYKFIGHVWQCRYFSSLITHDRYLWTCGMYIENNPVRAGLCHKPDEYEWTSYRYYAEGANNPIITGNPLLETLGRNRIDQSNNYRKLFDRS